jgi:hypothetical protein
LEDGDGGVEFGDCRRDRCALGLLLRALAVEGIEDLIRRRRCKAINSTKRALDIQLE